MGQPDHVPLAVADRVRPVEPLPTPEAWTPSRPGDLRAARQPTGALLGTPGPDQGFALHLASRFADRLRLGPGERLEDAVVGASAIALRRAARFGRAPVVHDCELAFGLLGLLDEAPEDLVRLRRGLLEGCAEDEWRQRLVAASVTDEALALSPAEARRRQAEWRRWFVADAGADGSTGAVEAASAAAS
jgi:hypothetical protein